MTRKAGSIGIGVVGYGYWGPNLVRNFAESTQARVVAVSDRDAARLGRASARYPAVETTTDYRAVIRNTAVDAVAIATPVSTHYELALAALEAGKHVLVEKPLAASVDEAERLADEAARRGLTLMVDHTFVYTGAVRKMKELVSAGALGEIYYYDSVRVNLGLFQHDVNVVWDLAVHDLSILTHLVAARPAAVSATGMSHFAGQPENVAFLTLFYEDTMIAHVHVNWLAPVKVRRTLIGGSQKMIVYDDLEPSEKLKVYDKGVTLQNGAEGSETLYQMLVGYRTGDMWSPQLDPTEALAAGTRHFLGCIETGEPPITGGEAGLEVVRLLEAASRSIAEQGRLVECRTRGVAAS